MLPSRRPAVQRRTHTRTPHALVKMALGPGKDGGGEVVAGEAAFDKSRAIIDHQRLLGHTRRGLFATAKAFAAAWLGSTNVYG
jgi:hypothetical protein